MGMVPELFHEAADRQTMLTHRWGGTEDYSQT